jgi:hypothetical protein
MKMQFLAGLGIAFGVIVSGISPAMAASPSLTSPVKAIDNARHMIKNHRCFEVKNGVNGYITVKYNLTTEQKDFLTRARFGSALDYENYIFLNSINNTMRSCLKRGWTVPGFVMTTKGSNTYVYNSRYTKFVLVNGEQKSEILGSVEITVDYPNPKAPAVITSVRGA